MCIQWKKSSKIKLTTWFNPKFREKKTSIRGNITCDCENQCHIGITPYNLSDIYQIFITSQIRIENGVPTYGKNLEKWILKLLAQIHTSKANVDNNLEDFNTLEIEENCAFQVNLC